MLVFGDASDRIDTRARLREIAAAAGAGLEIEGGQPGYWAACELFLSAAELAQGLIDLEFEARGADCDSPLNDAATQLVLSAARVLVRSWRGEPGESGGMKTALAALGRLPLPESVSCRRPEGYSFYAVYPEAYIEAAAQLGEVPIQAIGIRSIGLGLAAVIAAATGAAAPISVRPVGHPFQRQLSLSPALRRRLLRLNPAAGFAVADEGPGLSGSSFFAVIDLLTGGGIEEERIRLFPSHPGQPGGEAPAAKRERWHRLQRHVLEFDALYRWIPEPERRLDFWFADITGPPIEPLKDISWGSWRYEFYGHDTALWPASDVQQERRKFLLTTAKGTFLLKFAGLGRYGREKLARARVLHEAGFVPEMLAFAHGFTVERWVPERPADLGVMPRERLLARLAEYLIFRAQHFSGPQRAGASPEELATMLRQNGVEALGAEAEHSLARFCALGPMAAQRMVATDNRMHAWEWLSDAEGSLLKADAVDHCAAHDLIGAQGIAWDVAGAGVELSLSADEQRDLAARVGRALGEGTDDRLLVFTTACYLAFQLGYYSMAASALAGVPEEQARLLARTRLYRGELAGLLARSL
ncbi:MAG TPA: hypothetical protein VL418_09325 [Devosiaceae bacterium]|nr:hypothetical protein [Devosiaceae bacterium]